MYNKIKRKVFEILEPSAGDTFVKKIFDYFIISLIILNTIVFILETVEIFSKRYHNIFFIFETFTVIVFTIEYILRLWTCTFIGKYSRPIIGRIKYAFSVFALIDLFAFLPFYLYTMTRIDFIFIRLLRLFRFIRIFKLGRYSDAFNILGKVIKSKKEELILTFSISIILIVLSSSFIYMAEHEAQPDKFRNIPESMYWAVETLTSVGYGDIYPITPTGKFLTSLISLLGLCMVALPTGILASAFTQEIRKKKVCPHCGKEIT